MGQPAHRPEARGAASAERMAPGIDYATEFFQPPSRSQPRTEQMSNRKAISLFWAGCLLVLCSISAFSQSQTTGRIAGTVKDRNGARIVGAEVNVTSLATAEERKVTTDAEGNYTVPLLPPGTYRVKVTAGGFNAALFD